MNKEIKEILKQCDGVVKREIPLLILAPEYTQLLVDYINNLQQRINKAIEYIEQITEYVISSNIKEEEREYKRLEYLLDILRGKNND